MATTIARLRPDKFKIAGHIHERYPQVRNGLLAHFPLDGQYDSASLWTPGWSGSATANGTIQDIYKTSLILSKNICLKFSGWFKATGLNGTVTFCWYNYVNSAWNYTASTISNSFVNGQWVYIERYASVSTPSPDNPYTDGRQGISIRNDNTTGTLEWKDVNVYLTSDVVYPPQASGYEKNVIYTPKGAYIGGTTTNTLRDPEFTKLGDPQNGWTTTLASASAVMMPFLDGTYVPALKLTYSGSGDNYAICQSINSAQIQDSNWTFGFWIKASGGPGTMYGSCMLQENGGGYATFASWTFDTSSRPTEWTYVTMSGYVPMSAAGLRIILRPLGTTAGAIYYTQPMLIQSTVQSPYVKTSTSAVGQMDFMPSLIGKNAANEGTMCLRYNPYNSYSQGSYPAILTANWYSSPITSDWAGIYRGNGWNSGNTLYWGLFDGSKASSVMTPNVDISSRFKHDLYLGIGWSLSAHKYRAWCYDMTTNEWVLDYETTNTNFDGFSSITNIKCGYLSAGSEAQNGYHSDVSFYNRLLSSSEIKQNATSSLSFSKTGDLFTRQITNRPVYPTDCWYFPLTDDGYDISKTIKNCNGNTLQYKMGVHGVTSPNATNLFTHSSNGAFPVTNGKSFDVLIDDGYTTLYRNNFTGETWQYKGRDLSISANTDYYVYVEVYVSEDYNGNYGPMFNLEQAVSAGFSYDTSKKGTWQTWSYKVNVATAGTLRVLMYPAANNATGTQGYVLYRNPRVTQTSFIQSYTGDTTSGNGIAYNLNRDIGMNWAGNWSIVYWCYPYGTQSGTMAGYCISSLGSNSNSVGGGYIWWGKPSGSDTISAASPSAIDTNLYFNNWHMVSVTKSGSTIWFYEWGVGTGGATCIRSASCTTSAANYYVNQYGFDFKLGGWDNASSSNMAVRDLLVCPGRILTQAEYDAYQKTTMRQYDQGSINILGEIEDQATIT